MGVIGRITQSQIAGARIHPGNASDPFRLRARKRQSALSYGYRDCTNVLLRDLLDLRLGERGEIRRFGRDYSLKRLRMMGLQIIAEGIDGAALASCMADEDDRFSMDKIRGYLFVVGFFL